MMSNECGDVRVLAPPQLGSIINTLLLRELGLFEKASALTQKRTGSGDFYSRSTRQLMIARHKKLKSIRSPLPLQKQIGSASVQNNEPNSGFPTSIPHNGFAGNNSENEVMNATTRIRNPTRNINISQHQHNGFTSLKETELVQGGWHLINETGLLEFIDKTTRVVTIRPVTGGKPIVGKQLQLVDSYLFFHMKPFEISTGGGARDSQSEYGYHCFEYSYSQGRIRRRYILPNIPLPWKDTATWVPRIETNSTFIAHPKLFTLSHNSKELLSFDLDTGKKCEHILLDENIKFGEMVASEKFIYLEAIKSNVKASSGGKRIYEGILADVEDISNTIRFAIEPSAVPFRTKTNGYIMNSKVEVVGELILFGYTNKLKIADLFSTLNAQQNTQEQTSSNYVPLSKVISDAPDIVYETTTKSSYLEISDAGYPPHTITIEASSKMLIKDTLSGAKVKNHSSLDLSSNVLEADFEEPTLHFHPDESSRIVLCAGNRLVVYRLVRIVDLKCNGPSELVEEFLCKFMGQGLLELTTNGVRVKSPNQLCYSDEAISRYPDTFRIRPIRTVIGGLGNPGFEQIPNIVYQYAPHINSLVVMEVNTSPDALLFHFFDNDNWDLLFTLCPKNLVSMSYKDVEIMDFTFDVLDEVILVRRNQTASKILSEIYLIPLL